MSEVTSPSPEASRRTAWGTVAVLLFLNTYSLIDRQAINLLVGPIRQDLRIDDVEFSLLSGIAFVGFYALCGVPLGWLADRFDRRKVIFGGVAIWAAATTMCGLFRNYWTLLLGRFGVGAGEAALNPAAYSMISDLFPRDRLATAIATYTLGAFLGGAIGLAAGGALASFLIGTGPLEIWGWILQPWQQLFLILGLPGLLFAPLIFLVTEPTRRRGPQSSVLDGESVKLTQFIGSNGRLLACHFIGFACLSLMSYAFSTWAAAYLTRVHHWELSQVGWTLGLMQGIGGIAGLMASSALVDALFKRGIVNAHFWVYIPVLFLIAAAALIAFSGRSVQGFLIGGSLVVAMTANAGVAISGLQIITPGALRGRMTALYGLFMNLFSFGLGPLVVATITQNVFRDESRVGDGIMATILLAIPIALVAFAFGLQPMKRAVLTLQRK